MLTLEQHIALNENLSHHVNYRYFQINQGGCGFFAAMFSLELSKHDIDHSVHFIEAPQYGREYTNAGIHKLYDTLDLPQEERNVSGVIRGIEHKLVYSDGDDYDWDDLYEMMPNSHLVVRIGDNLYDARGDVTDRYNVLGDPIEFSALETMVMRKEYWNPNFREVHGDELPDIQAHIKHALATSLEVSTTHK